jgi:hypothetical protein
MVQEAFLRNTKALSDVKQILRIMHSYRNIHELGFEDLVHPDKVESTYLDWLKLHSKYDGNEMEFFSPDWFPISASNFDFFIVLNSDVLPIIYTSVKWFDNSNYEKYIYFYQSMHLLFFLDSGISYKEFY